MNTSLTASRFWAATAMIALVALTTGTPSARADYLVRTYADSAPAYVRSPLQQMPLLQQIVRSEPLTVLRPHEDTAEPPNEVIDKESLAVMIQALLICAIPPPDNTIVQTPTTTQPGAPAPPEFILPVYPPDSPPDGPHTADAPEPASLVTALVGTSITGLVFLRQRGKRRKRRRAQLEMTTS